MPPRRKAALATVAALYARVSPATRLGAMVIATLLAAGKVLAVFVALHVARGDGRGAVIFGVFATLAYGVVRIVSSRARIGAECDLQRALAQVLLDSDVLDTHAPSLRTLFEPLYHGRALVIDVAPELAATALAAVAAAPILASMLPARALVVSAIALAFVVAAQLAASRKSAAVLRSVFDAQVLVQDRAGFAIEGRLELVAHGREHDAMLSLDDALARYRETAKRAAWASAMLGRAPLAAGLGAVLLAVTLDASYREAVTSAIFGQALVLAACLPILLGLVLRASELLRLSTAVGPLLAAFAAPKRPELLRRGSAPPDLPATIATRDLQFAYVEDTAPTLEALSIDWPLGGLLLVEGPNGSGKTTLLRLLLGLRPPQRGSITVGSADLIGLDLLALRRGIAYLPQRAYLGEQETTVRIALRAFGGGESDSALRAALDRVGLDVSGRRELLDTAVGELSAGQRQRVALARALLQNASIYILDEPDANLDRAGISLVAEIVQQLGAQGRMVALAAHSKELAALPGTRVTLR